MKTKEHIPLETTTFSVMPSLLCPTLPVTPFLLTSLVKGGGERHFVIDKWDGVNTDIQDNGDCVQTFTWIAHKASEKEIKKFLEDKDE